MSFTSIPILDLSQARDPTTKPQFLAELRRALMEVGFLYLKNVGISDEMFREVIRLGKGFFDIPIEEKYVSTNRGRRAPWRYLGGRSTRFAGFSMPGAHSVS